VLDVREDVESLGDPAPDPLPPLVEPLLGVGRPAETKIDEAGRHDERGRSLVGVVDAESRGAAAQDPVDLVREPRLVSKLERSRHPRRQLGEKCREPGVVSLQVRRQLKEEDTQPLLESGHDVHQIAERLGGQAQPLEVGDLLRRP
jgi:hypothetical protein